MELVAAMVMVNAYAFTCLFMTGLLCCPGEPRYPELKSAHCWSQLCVLDYKHAPSSSHSWLMLAFNTHTHTHSVGWYEDWGLKGKKSFLKCFPVVPSSPYSFEI